MDTSAYQVIVVCVIGYSVLVLFVLMIAVACAQINATEPDVQDILDTEDTHVVGYEAAHVSWEEAQELDVQARQNLLAKLQPLPDDNHYTEPLA